MNPKTKLGTSHYITKTWSMYLNNICDVRQGAAEMSALLVVYT